MIAIMFTTILCNFCSFSSVFSTKFYTLVHLLDLSINVFSFKNSYSFKAKKKQELVIIRNVHIHVRYVDWF